jgi:hypothetical protein
MLNDDQITEAECVYLSIDSGGLSDDAIFKCREYIYNKCHEQHVYLEWLLIRWTNLRKGFTHLPKRVENTNTGITFTLVKQKKLNNYRKYKNGDWICNNCGDHQFSKNTICRMCNTTHSKN